MASQAQALPQEHVVQSDSARAPAGAEFRVPLASVWIPGLGQYLYDAPTAGITFSGLAAVGSVLYLTGDRDAVLQFDVLPRHTSGQRALTGALLVAAAGNLSAYDAFGRALPALQREGKYAFMPVTSEPVTSLFTAPWDVTFLARWTTWLHLAYTGAVTATLVTARNAPAVGYEPYKARDAAFVIGLALGAGVGEEALFRGWLYPMLHQKMGQRVWVSNSFQAAIFSGLHVPQAGPFAAVIGAWALYEGWLTKRNGWSVRESIFHHFWYNVAVATAEFLTDERMPAVAIVLPPLPFRGPQ